MNNNNSYVYNSYSSSGLNNNENMSEERLAYLKEKEDMINKRRKRSKTIGRSFLIIVILVVGFYLYINYFRPVKIDNRIDKNSIHYLTDLYYSDGRFYEKYLDEKEKKVYLHIFNDLKEVKTKTYIDCTNYGYESKAECASSINKMIDVILMDHPDMFWYRTSSGRYSDAHGIELDHHLVSTNKFQLYFVERKLLRKIDSVTKDLEKVSDYEKVKGIYDWLGVNKSYSDFIMTRKDGTAWSAILDKDTVCAGYAAATQLFLQRLGIESFLITGSTGGPHAWNMVELEDGYYWYDATVGGSVGPDSDWFYRGLLFSATGDYSVDIVNLEEYTFGTKYLDRELKK